MNSTARQADSAGTRPRHFGVPPKGMIGNLFTQRMMDSPKAPNVFFDFWTLACGAME